MAGVQPGDVLPCGHVVEAWMLEDGPVAHQGPSAINWLYRDTHDNMCSRSRSRSRGRENDCEEGFELTTDADGNEKKNAVWMEPQFGDPILCFDRKWAELIVDGVKTLELRTYFLRKFKSGTRIWIAAKQDPHQGRRAYPSPLGPEFNPRKSEILGSVCFSSQSSIHPEEFSDLFSFHRVEYREDVPVGKSCDGQVLRGWYFEHAVKAPEPREYVFKKGSQCWRKFQGWL